MIPPAHEVDLWMECAPFEVVDGEHPIEDPERRVQTLTRRPSIVQAHEQIGPTVALLQALDARLERFQPASAKPGGRDK
jgi:hypothetical protein